MASPEADKADAPSSASVGERQGEVVHQRPFVDVHTPQKAYSITDGNSSDSMPSSFIRAKPLQALKLTAVLAVLAFACVGVVGMLPGQELTGLLVLAFFPLVIGVVVIVEALLAGYRLVRAGDPGARLTARRGYTAIRVLELVVTVLAPVIFYVLIVQMGSEVSGPGAIGLLFIGIGLGMVAYGSVVLRTLAEYLYYRRRSPMASTETGGREVVD